MTEDNKNKIKKIMKEHLETIDILRVLEVPVEAKANRIYQEFRPLYEKLEKEKILPEGCSWDVFQQLGVRILEATANHAMLHRSFVF
jgi:hypothetical protein